MRTNGRKNVVTLIGISQCYESDKKEKCVSKMAPSNEDERKVHSRNVEYNEYISNNG
jgi:hypothetical protein